MLHRVRNLREGGRPAPAGYRSWLDYWEKSTRLKADFCHVLRCISAATDGAHVQLVDNPFDSRWYIVPMCHHHNCQFGEVLTVQGPLVAATDPKVILR